MGRLYHLSYRAVDNFVNKWKRAGAVADPGPISVAGKGCPAIAPGEV